MGTVALGISGCGGPPPNPAELKIAAAADLKFALDEVVAAFRTAEPDVAVKVTFGASGNLCAQIENGAPFDVFLSADVVYPRRLIQEGMAREDSLFPYAIGHLVLWVPSSSPIDLAAGAAAVLDPAARKVAIANPEHAPYGRAAVAALKSLGVYEAVAPRLVRGENVAQTAQFVETGAADIGVIALSLALAPPMKTKGRYWEIPTSAHPPLEQAGVVIAATQHPREAAAFREFMRSAKARAILARYGFVLPPGSTP